MLIGPLLLLSALGLARARAPSGLVRRADRLAVVGLTGSFVLDNKSNVAHGSRAVERRVRPGDLVVSTQPEQVPVLHYYLPAGPALRDSARPVADPRVMDWRDAVDRCAPRRRAAADPLIAALRPGQRVLW